MFVIHAIEKAVRVDGTPRGLGVRCWQSSALFSDGARFRSEDLIDVAAQR